MSDTELTELLLRRTFAQADIRVANDAISFAEVLSASAPDLAIIAPKLNWVNSDKLIALLRRQCPTTRIVLFGHEADVLEQSMSPGLALDGIVRKSSAGYLALAGIVADVLERGRSDAVRNDAEVEVTRSIALEELPLPAFMVAEDGMLSAANSEFAHFLEVTRGLLTTTPLERFLNDGDEQWHKLRARSDGSPVRLELRGAGGRTGTALVRRVRDAPPGARYLGLLAPLATTPTATPATLAAGGAEPFNQEMRDIALVFSHDLKEPVQQIARIAQRGDEPSDSAARTRALQQILECASRASHLLESMLEYLAVSARDSAPVLVDLNLSLQQALDNLRGVVDEADAQITADRLPSIVGDEYQMLHLFQNLISNAVKFRGRERPEIRISAEAQGDDWVVAFRDNGIGVPQPFLQRVFEMGQRLHTRDEYPGTGVGLALCKRIVERHGGRIWVTSNDGAGSTFYVRLPRAPAHITRLA